MKMTDVHRAHRQFERMFPEIAYQENLRATDPEKYREHMRALNSRRINPEQGKLIATIIYDPDKKEVRIVREDEI